MLQPAANAALYLSARHPLRRNSWHPFVSVSARSAGRNHNQSAVVQGRTPSRTCDSAPTRTRASDCRVSARMRPDITGSGAPLLRVQVKVVGESVIHNEETLSLSRAHDQDTTHAVIVMSYMKGV